MKKSERIWDFLARNYDQDEDISAERKDIEIVKRYLHPSDTILELACGTGTLSIEIAGSVKEIQAIDISSKMVEAASRKSAERQVQNITFIHGSIGDPRFQNETYDAILAFNILHLLEDLDLTLDRISQLLKPGGLFISNTPCLGEKMPGVFRLILPLLIFSSKMGIFLHINNFKSAELERLIENKNFKILETENFIDSALSHFIVARKIAVEDPALIDLIEENMK